MKPLVLKLLSFLIPAGLSLAFLIWWFSPSQVLTRTAKDLVATFEVRALGLETRPALNERFATLLAPHIEVVGTDPIPRETLSRAELVDLHERFQTVTLSCRASARDFEVKILSPTTAVVTTEVQADLKIAGGQRQVRRYRTALTYKKAGKSWLLTKVQALLR